MIRAYDKEAGWWYWYDSNTNKKVRWLRADEVAALPVGERQTYEGDSYAESPVPPPDLPTIIPPPETDEDGTEPRHEIGGDETPLNTEDAARLNRWNENLPEGAIKIGASELAAAKSYTNIGYTFEESLNLYSQWKGLNPIVPDPWTVATPELGQAYLESRTAAAEERHELDRFAGGGARGVPAAGPPPEIADLPVVQAIYAATDDPRIRAAMILAAQLEGGLAGPWGTKPGEPGVGDEGRAYGPFQIHALPPEEAVDPERAVQYMLHEHQGGAATFLSALDVVPEGLWETDPLAAAALMVAEAERVGGWKEGLTAEEALTIYGGREHVETVFTQVGGAAVAGTLTDVAGRPFVPPGEEPEHRELTDAERAEWSDLSAKYGIPQHAYLSAKIQGIEGEDAIVDHWMSLVDQGDLLEYKRQNEPLVARLGAEWTDEDWATASQLGMNQQEITSALRRGQAPRQWWDEQVKEQEAFLKEQGLTWADLDIMEQAGLTVPDYQTMRELNMEPLEWQAAIDRLGSPDAVWQATQLGYNPAQMSAAQTAQFSLKTDLNVAAMRAWEAIPENVRPELPAGATQNIATGYAEAQAQARVQGKYLTPDEFLKTAYPGFFGGGTVDELRHDLQTLMGPPSREQAPTFMKRKNPWALAAEPWSGIGQEVRALKWRAQNPDPYGEMLYQRGLAQKYLTGAEPGAVTQEGPAAQARYAEIQRRVAEGYPDLAQRAEEGETEEEKRRRRRLATLKPAGGGGGTGGFTLKL